jgi:hypothetical protein
MLLLNSPTCPSYAITTAKADRQGRFRLLTFPPVVIFIESKDYEPFVTVLNGPEPIKVNLHDHGTRRWILPRCTTDQALHNRSGPIRYSFPEDGGTHGAHDIDYEQTVVSFGKSVRFWRSGQDFTPPKDFRQGLLGFGRRRELRRGLSLFLVGTAVSISERKAQTAESHDGLARQRISQSMNWFRPKLQRWSTASSRRPAPNEVQELGNGISFPWREPGGWMMARGR